MARRAWLLAALLAIPLSGCFEPFGVRVPQEVLDRSPLGWRETVHGVVGAGWLSTKQQARNYDTGPDASPPGRLEVHALRSSNHPGLDGLLERARTELYSYAERHGLAIDASMDRTGDRSWDSGVRTRWLTTQAQASGGTLFTPNYKVRLIAEVGHDGRSDTAIVALGAAQVQVCKPGLLGTCTVESSDITWRTIVGDPDGSVTTWDSGSTGAVVDGGHGLLVSLVTH